MTIKDKILYFLKERGISREVFYQNTGLSPSNFKGIALKSELGGDKIVKILSVYKEISPDWLLLDNGSMLRSDITNDVISAKPNSVQMEDSFIYKMYKEKDDENKTLIKQNAVLEERIRQLEADNESLRSQSGADRVTDTFTNLPLVDYEEDCPPVERPSSSKHPLAGKA